MDTQVVIVGAGPTGLMAAALLARCGVRVRLFDQNDGQAKESRAFGVQPKSMELFLNMGLSEKFLERGLLATGAEICVDGSSVAELHFDDIGRTDTPYSFLLMVPQSEIEEILAADVRAQGMEIEHGHEVIGFEQTAEGVVTQVRDTAGKVSSVESAYLIGADGAHSIVRKTLGLTFKGAPYPQGFFLADCKIDGLPTYERMTIFLHETNFAIYLPLRGRDLGRVVCVRPVEDPGTPGSAEASTSAPLQLQEVEDAFRKATCLDVKLSQPGWLSRYRSHHRGVNQYRKGRAFVAGDAAHIHSPAGGQGMNTGLQDAANLAWKLALALRGSGSSMLLDTYHGERWPVGQNVLKYTDRLFSNMTSQTGWRATLRNHLIPLLAGVVAKSGTIRARAFHFISQLGIRYENVDFLQDDLSPGASSEWKSGLTPGHRAPNASISRDIDVFGLIAGYGFHVLALSEKSLGREEIEEIFGELASLPTDIGLPLKTHLIAHSLLGRDPRLLRAESSQVFQAYGITPTQSQGIYLIRPDGFIAFRSDRLHVLRLRAFLLKLSA